MMIRYYSVYWWHFISKTLYKRLTVRNQPKFITLTKLTSRTLIFPEWAASQRKYTFWLVGTLNASQCWIGTKPFLFSGFCGESLAFDSGLTVAVKSHGHATGLGSYDNATRQTILSTKFLTILKMGRTLVSYL